jgi:DNA-binding transcriptional ArsR family regulator
MTTPLDHVFAALADPTRREILRMLLEDDMAVTDVAHPFAMSLAAISQHLTILAAAGLISQEKRGRVKWCKLEPDALRAATRDEPPELPPEQGHHYVAAIDPATRGNAWSLVVLTRSRQSEGGGRRVVLCREWIGSRIMPLSPAAVLAEIADILRPYAVRVVATDQWSSDALRDIGLPLGLSLQQISLTAPWILDLHDTIRIDISQGKLELCPGRLPQDLSRVAKRVTRYGVIIDLPRTADGRHCDSAAALALAYSLPCPSATELPGAAALERRQGWTDEELAMVASMEQRLAERSG